MDAIHRQDILTLALATVGAFSVLRVLFKHIRSLLRGLLISVPRVTVPIEDDAEVKGTLEGRQKYDPTARRSQEKVHCWDPATFDFLGEKPAMGREEVKRKIALARAAQRHWGQSTFDQRRQLLRIMKRFIGENMDTILTVACRDSGKTKLDAMFGEALTTLEKLRWTIEKGEDWLQPDYRDSGPMNMHKTSRVEYVPLGVIGAIVPFNYPFHNVFNPLIAAIFSGNAIVIKVSEFASWSVGYYERVIRACLGAAGAPLDLVQIVTGFSEAGNALVTGGVDKIIFVGSVGVGKVVMRDASDSLTPVILELGGKDFFVICGDADVHGLEQVACRGVFQNMGQNCAGPERFIVNRQVYDSFCRNVGEVVTQLKTAPPLGDEVADCGACCLPQSLTKYQMLVDDAVSKGARLLAGGKVEDVTGQFYPPTVLCDVRTDMLIMQEEIFGPIMCIVPVESDEMAIDVANRTSFALGGCVFSSSHDHAKAICSKIRSGMAAINDLEGVTYLSQSLPFGGCNDSGFGRFAGPEGLRGLCLERSIVENRSSFLPRASIPKAIAYPQRNGRQGEKFVAGLINLLYGYSAFDRLSGVAQIIGASVFPTSSKTKSQ